MGICGKCVKNLSGFYNISLVSASFFGEFALIYDKPNAGK